METDVKSQPKSDEKPDEAIEPSHANVPKLATVFSDGSASPSKYPRSPALVHRLSVIQKKEKGVSEIAGGFTELSGGDLMKVNRRLDDQMIENIRENEAQHDRFKLSDILEFMSEGIDVIASDDFSLCFKRTELRSWNWNVYLFIFWLIGFFLRYCIFFPLRLIIMTLSLLITCLFLWLWGKIYPKPEDAAIREKRELWTLTFLVKSWMFAWTSVIEYKGVIPKKKPNQIYVANHSTMLDWLLLMNMRPFCVVGQLHTSKPFIAWIQLELLKSLRCIWFNRKETKDRMLAAKKIKDHIANPKSPRLLLFPEGTCVNNEYCIQFKRGSFGMGAEICPIAIRYNKTFVDAYWISRERPFHWHLFDIMTSWAMVATVHYLEPQTIRPNEKPEEFAMRVKTMIAQVGGLKNVEWNGYLKHYRPSNRIIDEQKKLFADRLHRTYGHMLRRRLSIEKTQELTEEPSTAPTQEESAELRHRTSQKG